MAGLLAQMRTDKEEKQKAQNRVLKVKIKDALRNRINQEGLGADEENSEAQSQLEQLYESDESDGS